MCTGLTLAQWNRKIFHLSHASYTRSNVLLTRCCCAGCWPDNYRCHFDVACYPRNTEQERRQRLHTTVSLTEHRRVEWYFAIFAVEQIIENVVQILGFATVSTAGSNRSALHTVVKLHYKSATKLGIISILTVNSSTALLRTYYIICPLQQRT
jgi:hypothetical protein